MRFGMPATISAWEWFKFQLRLYALERRAPAWVTTFAFDDETEHVSCYIWCKTTQQLIEHNASIEEQRKYYDGWVSGQEHQMRELASITPGIGDAFDIAGDVTYQILYDYGMGSTLVCEYAKGEFIWKYPSTGERDAGSAS